MTLNNWHQKFRSRWYTQHAIPKDNGRNIQQSIQAIKRRCAHDKVLILHKHWCKYGNVFLVISE